MPVITFHDLVTVFLVGALVGSAATSVLFYYVLKPKKK